MLDNFDISNNLEDSQTSSGFFPIDQQTLPFSPFQNPFYCDSQPFCESDSQFFSKNNDVSDAFMFFQATTSTAHEPLTEELSSNHPTSSVGSSPRANKTRSSGRSLVPAAVSSDDIDVAKYPVEVIEEIKFLALKYKRDWKKISKRIETQHHMVIDHFVLRQICKTLESGTQKRVKFSEEDDEALLRAVEAESMNWFNVATYFPDRTPLSLRNRYYVLTKNSKGSKKSSSDTKKNGSAGSSKPKRSQNLSLSNKGKDFSIPNDLTEAPVSLLTSVSNLKFKQNPDWLDLINSILSEKI